MDDSGLRYLVRIGSELRTGQVAEYLGITGEEVRRLGMLADGLRPVFTPSGQRRYHARDVWDYAQRIKRSTD
jgi:hypothetical protein